VDKDCKGRKKYSKQKMKVVESNMVNWRGQNWDTLQSNLEQMGGEKKNEEQRCLTVKGCKSQGDR